MYRRTGFAGRDSSTEEGEDTRLGALDHRAVPDCQFATIEVTVVMPEKQRVATQERNVVVVGHLGVP